MASETPCFDQFFHRGFVAAEQYRITPLTDGVGFLPMVSENQRLLLRQRADEIGAQLRMEEEKSKSCLPGPGDAGIVQDNFFLPLCVQQFSVTPDRLGIHRAGTDEKRRALAPNHDQNLPALIDEFRETTVYQFFGSLISGRIKLGWIRLQHALGLHGGKRRGRAADKDIPEVLAGFALRANLWRCFRTGDERRYSTAMLNLFSNG